MRKNGVLTYMLTDHLGSTSLTTSDMGTVISELRYTAWGEVRYQAGTTSTGYTYTGQYSNTADFGLMFYNARWYDPALGRFAQADSIVPAGVQGYDRYAYANNNPVRYTDPSGHSVCGLSGSGVCTKDEELVAFADKTVLDYGGKNDLEAVARIVDKAARLYVTYGEMIPALSTIFLGIQESNPLTLINAVGANECAATGREPKDCGSNSAGEVIWDTGFHREFRDGHSQAYHFWAYLATTASTDISVGGPILGYYLGQAGNFVHEIMGLPDPSGATWQDFALSEEAMNIGLLVSFGLIEPSNLGNYIRAHVGTQSDGAFYVTPLLYTSPLQGNSTWWR